MISKDFARSVFWNCTASASLVIVLLYCSAASAEITRIISFGDSLSDTGNHFEASGGLVNGPPHWQGRRSNGPVWVEYLADFIGVPRPVASRLGGTNAAFGNATTGQGTFPDPAGTVGVQIPRIGAQIDEILADHSLGPTDLILIWAGHVDVNPTLPGGPLTPTEIVDNVTDHILTLQNAGATNFLVGNLAHSMETSPVNSAWSLRANELRSTQPINLRILDFTLLRSRFGSDPSRYGFNAPDWNVPIIDRMVANPEQYAWWDARHPTTALHRVIAETALNALRHVDGDYNDNGLVEQGDLDLVLLHWGQRPSRDLLVTSWLNDTPTGRLVDQDELDRLLLHWGDIPLVPNALQSQAAVPEPTSGALLLVTLIAGMSFWNLKTRFSVLYKHTVPQLVSILLLLWFTTRSAHAQFSTIINVPPDPAPRSIGSDTQLNVLEGAILRSSHSIPFQAGNPDGTSSNVEDGTVGTQFVANSGSRVNISGGTVGPSFDASSGSRVNLSGGTVGQHFHAPRDSETTLFGGEFLFNGVTPATSTINLAESDLFSGTLQDGSPFLFSPLRGDQMHGVTLAHVSLPGLDLAPIVVDSVSQLSGLREGQSLTLTEGGVLNDNFAVVNATLNVQGGRIGDGLEIAGSQVTISGGAVFHYVGVLGGSQVNISGGHVGNFFDVFDGAEVNISGGLVGQDFWAHPGSEVNISGGSIDGGFQARSDSQISISGGTVTGWFEATGSQVAVSGGSVGFVEAEAGTQVVVTGGNLSSPDGVHAHNGSRVVIAGGATSFDAYDDSEVHIFGTQFALDGTELPDIELGESFTILARDIHLTGSWRMVHPLAMNFPVMLAWTVPTPLSSPTLR